MQTPTVCLQVDEMRSFIANDLPDDRAAEVESHLSVCESCRDTLQGTVGDPNWWSDLERALGATPAVDSSSEEEICNDNGHRLIDLLGPTDDPNMLGRIGSYEVVALLGQGGMGAVFKAFDRSLNRYVAIKVLLPHLAASGAAHQRFAREAQAAAAVVDDHVMAIHGVSEWNSIPYFVMPYSRGVSLQKRLSQEGPLDLREILRIGFQIAKGLAAAHSQGLVHRDIKPANIFLDEGVERVQLMDFGLARAVDDASLTRSGVLAGTPQYMSPEQARAEKVDHRSDLFSLGSVLYAMSAGHAPFRAESSYSILRLITDKEPRPIREVNTDIPQWLCAIIGKLMSKQPEDRFDGAQQVVELLENCLAHVQEPTTTPLPTSVAELAKSFGPRDADSRPTESLGGFCFPPIKKLITAAAFAFLLVAGAIIFLQTGKGTIRIETNTEVDVPIVIRQGDEVVKHLTVSQDGATTSLKAGKYVIKVEGDDTNFTITGGEFRLNRGETWLATIEDLSGSGAKKARHPAPSVYESGDHAFSHNRGIVDKVLDNWEVIISLQKPDSVKIGERLQVSRPQPEFGQYWNFAWIEIVEMVSASEGVARARVVQTRREQNGNRFDWMKLKRGDHVTSPDDRTLEQAGMESPKGLASEEQITVNKARASHAAKLKQLERTYGPRHPETVATSKKVEQLDRLLVALKSFRFPKNGKSGITVWRQATPRSGSFSTVHDDDAITLFDAIDSFEDRCATMDKTAIAVFSEDSSKVEFVDYATLRTFTDDYTLTRGQLVILLAPPKFDEAGMMGMPLTDSTKAVESVSHNNGVSQLEKYSPISFWGDDDDCEAEFKPTPEAILESLAKREKHEPKSIVGLYEKNRDEFQFEVTKIKDEVLPQREYPLVGPAKLHRLHFKCKVTFSETIRSSWPIAHSVNDQREDVVYLTMDHLHRVNRSEQPEQGIPTNGSANPVPIRDSEPAAAEYREQLIRLNHQVELNETSIKDIKRRIQSIKDDPKKAGIGSTGKTTLEAQEKRLRDHEKSRAAIQADLSFTRRQLLSYIAILEERCNVATKAKELAQTRAERIQLLVKKNLVANAELAKAQLALDEAKLKLAETLRRMESYKAVADELKLSAQRSSAFLQKNHGDSIQPNSASDSFVENLANADDGLGGQIGSQAPLNNASATDTGRTEDILPQRQHGFVTVGSPTSLEDAVSMFNEMAQHNDTGKNQPKLTKDEVIAALRMFSDRKECTAETRSELQEIIGTKYLKPGQQLTFNTRYVSEGHIFDVWEIGFGREGTPPWFSIREATLLSRQKSEKEKKLWDEMKTEMAKSFRNFKGSPIDLWEKQKEPTKLEQLLKKVHQSSASDSTEQVH